VSGLTDSLDNFIEIGTKPNTDRKKGLPDCHNCRKSEQCEVLDRVDSLRSMKPRKGGVQSNLFEPHRKDSSYETKHREWKSEYLKAMREQHVCLQRRTFLHNRMKYDLFNLEGIVNG
jgi:hypothetical protein